MRPLLIGLNGRARVGKDAAGGFLNRRHGLELYSFARPIKAAVEVMFDLPSSIWHDDRKEQVIDWLGKSPRQLVQTLGTEWGRHMVRADVWTIAMRHRWALVKQMGAAGMCVTDVRFADEAEALRRMGGCVVRIIRPGVESVAAHVSEAGIPDELVDFTVWNGGTLLDLERAMDAIVERLLA